LKSSAKNKTAALKLTLSKAETQNKDAFVFLHLATQRLASPADGRAWILFEMSPKL
jgi:ribosomal protein L39E